MRRGLGRPATRPRRARALPAPRRAAEPLCRRAAVPLCRTPAVLSSGHVPGYRFLRSRASLIVCGRYRKFPENSREPEEPETPGNAKNPRIAQYPELKRVKAGPRGACGSASPRCSAATLSDCAERVSHSGGHVPNGEGTRISKAPRWHAASQQQRPSVPPSPLAEREPEGEVLFAGDGEVARPARRHSPLLTRGFRKKGWTIPHCSRMVTLLCSRRAANKTKGGDPMPESTCRPFSATANGKEAGIRGAEIKEDAAH